MKTVLIVVIVLFSGSFAFSQPAKDYFKAGEKLYRAGKYKEAIEQYSLAIQFDEKYIDAIIQRGFTYTLVDEFTKAIEDYTTVINMEPKHKWAYISRGSAYKNIKEYIRINHIFFYEYLKYLNPFF